MRALAGGAAILGVLAVSVGASAAAPGQTLPDVSAPKVQTPGSDQNAVLGASRSSDEQRTEDGEVVRGAPPGGADGEPASDDEGPTLVLWLVAFALMSTSAVVLVRRRRKPPAANLPPALPPAPWAEKDAARRD